MLDRGKVIDANFTQHVLGENFPHSVLTYTPADVGLDKKSFLSLMDSQFISRHLDLEARALKEKNLGFYTIGSSGHEGNAAVAMAFQYTDPAFLHYRSGAFMVQRAQQLPEVDMIRDILLSLAASSEDPIAGGRHKVFGSLALTVPPQTSTIASHLPKALGAAISITRAKELKIKSHFKENSVVLCSFGDASLNHSTSQGALNAAQWTAHGSYPLPIVFVCEDNGTGISVRTPVDWVERSVTGRPHFHYIHVDGLHLLDVYRGAVQAEYIARQKKQPVFLHVRTIRLMGHAGSDIEHVYRSVCDIEKNEAADPLLHTARIAYENSYMNSKEIVERYEYWRGLIQKQAEEVIKRPRLRNAQEVMASLIPPKKTENIKKNISEKDREKVFAELYPQLKIKRNLCQNLTFALLDSMLAYDNVVLFGEDVAKKGGVYHVTAGLFQRFGQRRVFDTLLDEQTILGTAIGMAHNGFLPIPEIQFLAYLHNAIDQLRGEASTLSFFSNGQYTNPMVIRIAGLAYQKGFGGHFHNDNSFAAIRDIPGVMIACPSNGADGAKMLRECIRVAQEEQRVIVFLEPIALYMTKDLHEAGDNEWLFEYPPLNETLSFGELGVYGAGKDLVILTYGNGYYLSRQAEKILKEKHKINIKIVDLRWLAPLNEKAILKEVSGYKKILIVDECRKTGSISEALTTLLYEGLKEKVEIKRITGEDSFIPLGDAWKYVLPSRDDIVEKVVGMFK